jgi:uridylate kinase
MTAGERKETVVVSLGGSIMAPETIDPGFIRTVAEMFIRLSADRRLVIVVGGGKTARKYIAAGRELGVSEFVLDELGIRASRLNARLLVAALGDSAPPDVPGELTDALELARDYPIVVMGGTQPGHTTDAVAALMAEGLGASRFINATSVDGVYDKDPNLHNDAKHIPELTAGALLAICQSSTTGGAGPNVVLDVLAASVLLRSGIPGAVVDGRDTPNLEAAVTGGKFRGTVVTPSKP